MDNEKCIKVALELEIDPLKVIMATDMDKADRSGQQSLWTVFSQRMAATAASVVVAAGVNFILTTQNAEASTRMASFNADPATNLYYVKLRTKLQAAPVLRRQPRLADNVTLLRPQPL